MTYTQTVTLGLVLALGSLQLSHAARKVSADQPIQVRLELRYQALLTFPEPLERVIGQAKPDATQPQAPAEKQSISVEFYNHILGLSLVEPDAVGRLGVIGESGKLYLINFKPGSPGDDLVEVVSAPGKEAQAQPLTPAGLLRVLKLGEVLPGQTVEAVALPGLPDARLRILEGQSLGIPQGIGQVLRVENTTPAGLDLDVRTGQLALVPEPSATVVALRTWTWPPALTVRLVHADHTHLAPGGQTHILVVYERRVP